MFEDDEPCLDFRVLRATVDDDEPVLSFNLCEPAGAPLGSEGSLPKQPLKKRKTASKLSKPSQGLPEREPLAAPASGKNVRSTPGDHRRMLPLPQEVQKGFGFMKSFVTNALRSGSHRKDCLPWRAPCLHLPFGVCVCVWR